MSWSIPASLVTAVSLAVAMPSAPASDAAIVRDAQTLLERVAPADGPGVAMLIARGDRVLFRGARGRANVELGVPLSPDHVFRIASVTKTFTAALVLRLVDDGKLSLDDRVSAYVPDAPNAQAITVRQLLSTPPAFRKDAARSRSTFRRALPGATRMRATSCSDSWSSASPASRGTWRCSGWSVRSP